MGKIFHPCSDVCFERFDDYAQWVVSNKIHVPQQWLGLLTHQHSFEMHNLAVEYSLINTLESMGYGVIPVFSSANVEGCEASSQLNQLIESFWKQDGRLLISGLINFQMVAGLGGAKGNDLYEQAANRFKAMNIPVFRPVVSYFSDEATWLANPLGLSNEIAHAFTVNEMSGMIEPILVGCREDGLIAKPISERVEKFCKRVDRWMQLRALSNAQKKVVLMLHAAPCSGLEATVGSGAGLDVFESCVGLMKRLQSAGYRLREVPEDGHALKAKMLTHRAIQDFRWTAVEEIVDQGGALHLMDALEGYELYFDELSEVSRQQLLENWGPIPGEAMVLNNQLVITGLDFGHILVMLQPKRGCYGAKCTGEVCKMLHDPNCPPSHHYLATYRFIEREWGAHAILHIGTSGSLEYLPGKSNALSENCWPDIVLGNLINGYVYNAGVGTEGLTAKRRSQAVIIDHMPAAMGVPFEYKEMADLSSLEHEMKWGRETQKHILGKSPNQGGMLMYLYESVEGSGAFEGLTPDYVTKKLVDQSQWQTARKLLCHTDSELDAVIQLLNGGFIAPGPAGYPSDGLETILPTGRNFHTMLVEKVPTMLAYEKGCEMAEALIATYMETNGMPPEKVAMNMISTDITATQGEQLSMILSLMGIRPIWAPNEKVIGLVPLALSELNRPRIDVTTRISGVLRDAYPEVIHLLDRASVMAAALDEHIEDNYVKKHTAELFNELLAQENLAIENNRCLDKESTQKRLRVIERRATTRIFGDKPGTYGAGVDLALKASAWENHEDIAAIFTEFSAYAYGEGLQGDTDPTTFIHNLKAADASFETSVSKRYDLLSSGFSASVHGGISSLKVHLGQAAPRQYHCNTGGRKDRQVKPLADEAELILSETVNLEMWLNAQMEQGREGAAECMRRVQSIFNWQCLSRTFSDQSLEKAATCLLLNASVHEWLKDENPFALEEISRRFMEMVQRQVWCPSDETLSQLKQVYVKIEGEMESLSETEGTNHVDKQGGTVEIVSYRQVPAWQKKLETSLKPLQG